MIISIAHEGKFEELVKTLVKYQYLVYHVSLACFRAVHSRSVIPEK